LSVFCSYLASGDQQKSIAKNYRVGRSTVCEIIHETTDLIYQALQPRFLPVPSTAEWKLIADDFENLWQFPNCVGAIDGKHFEIPQPPDTGTTYFNYKVCINTKLIDFMD
jgi:hypothetical protein